MSEIEIDSFENLYKVACEARGEDEEHMEMYKDLDNLASFIENESENTKKIIMMGFDPNRTCITIPYNNPVADQRRLPDGEDEDGNPVSFETPLVSSMQSLLIDQMDNSYIPEYFQDERYLVTWKLKRLEKMYSMGWKAFVEQYLEGLMGNK